MELSAKVEYALIALLELASQPSQNGPMQIKQIAERQKIPDRYLEQVFAILRQAGIVYSQRGNKGGYMLAREPWQITLLEIFSCLEELKGSKRLQANAPSDSLLVQDVWKEAQQTAREVLQRYTLRDLCQQREARQRLGGMYYI
ncbi:MAG: Rrf2 family transcriptional regulator [Oculatellaceae cyanobacterium bins.114]|nr:Rrf2 family transcriptional regulator [Oculatellaceae cyanobacterium bins.114]